MFRSNTAGGETTESVTIRDIELPLRWLPLRRFWRQGDTGISASG